MAASGGARTKECLERSTPESPERRLAAWARRRPGRTARAFLAASLIGAPPALAGAADALPAGTGAGTSGALAMLCVAIGMGLVVTAAALVHQAGARRRAERKLRDSADEMEHLVSLANALVVGLDAAGRVRTLNPAAEAMTGYTAQELAGDDGLSRIVPRDRCPEAWETLRASSRGPLRASRARSFESLVVTKAGTEHQVSWRMVPPPTAGGEVAALAVGTDVTERARAEGTLRLENRLNEIFNTFPGDEIYGEVLSVVLEAMRSEYGVFAYAAEDGALVAPSLTRGVWEKCQVPDKRIVFRRDSWGASLWGRAVADRKSVYSNGPLSVPEGHIRLRRALAVPVLYREEAIGLLLVADKQADYDGQDVEKLERMARSISATLNARLQRDRLEERRKAVEQALRDSERELREAQRLGRLGSWSWDVASDRITWSDEYYRIYGIDPSTRPPGYQEHLKAYTPDSAVRLDAAVKRNMETGEPYEVDLELVQTDGPTRWVTARSETLRDSAGRIVGLRGTAQDITARKTAEEARRRSEERYRRIVETAHEGIWLIDAAARTTFVNRKMAEMLGYAVEEMQGASLLAFMDEEARRHAESLLDRRRRGIAEQHEFRFRCKDGKDLWALVETTPFLDEQGGFAGALAMVTDVTERRGMEEQLRQSQKLEAVGRLAGGVAHDFNNLLTAILGGAQLLADGLAPSSPLRQEALEIQEAGRKAALLTRQLLAFGRKQAARPVVVDLGEIVTGLDRMLRRLIGEDVELVTAARPGAGCVRADPGQIEQVIVNLAVNARDAMPAGGRLTIETASVELGEDVTRRHAEAKPGPHVMLAVSDTGVGMTPEVRGHLFEPFFTTKRQGEGTGLGLSTVYGIVKQCGGEIGVCSEPGKGTVFKIYFPRVAAPAEPIVPAPAPRGAARGTETVLVVEDEVMVRTLAVRVLRQAGYDVLEAGDGEEALRLAAGAKDRKIELMVSDVVMPHMGGPELAQRLRAERPELRVLLMSGYTDRAGDVEAQLGARTAFLSKPFASSELLRKVREVLDRHDAP